MQNSRLSAIIYFDKNEIFSPIVCLTWLICDKWSLNIPELIFFNLFSLFNDDLEAAVAYGPC